MRVIVLILTALVFGALLLFDTTALIQLSWLCLTGYCGVSAGWVAGGLGVLILACLVPGVIARLRRRRKPARGKPRPAARRKRAKS